MTGIGSRFPITVYPGSNILVEDNHTRSSRLAKEKQGWDQFHQSESTAESLRNQLHQQQTTNGNLRSQLSTTQRDLNLEKVQTSGLQSSLQSKQTALEQEKAARKESESKNKEQMKKISEIEAELTAKTVNIEHLEEENRKLVQKCQQLEEDNNRLQIYVVRSQNRMLETRSQVIHVLNTVYGLIVAYLLQCLSSLYVFSFHHEIPCCTFISIQRHFYIRYVHNMARGIANPKYTA